MRQQLLSLLLVLAAGQGPAVVLQGRRQHQQPRIVPLLQLLARLLVRWRHLAR
jgi:hypothetical protein